MQAVVSVVEIRLHLHDEAAALAATEYLRCGHTCAGGPEPEPLCQQTVDAKLRRSCHRPFQLQTLPNRWHGWDPGEPERICFAKLCHYNDNNNNNNNNISLASLRTDHACVPCSLITALSDLPSLLDSAEGLLRLLSYSCLLAVICMHAHSAPRSCLSAPAPLVALSGCFLFHIGLGFLW